MTETVAENDDTGRLHSVVTGDDRRPPVVLLHGFGGNYTVWHDVAAAVSRERRVIAVDLPGHGGSRPWPEIGTATVAAKAVIAELDARDLDRIHLAGHSLGGAVAALVALRASERISSLTLLAPGGFGAEINSRLLKRYAVARDEANLRPLVEQFFGWRNPVPDELIADMVAERADLVVTETFAAIAAEIFKGDTQGVLPRDRLAELPCPVKVLWGTQDRVLPTRQAHHLPGLVASHVFEEVGHMLPLEIPDEISRLILQNAAHD